MAANSSPIQASKLSGRVVGLRPRQAEAPTISRSISARKGDAALGRIPGLEGGERRGGVAPGSSRGGRRGPQRRPGRSGRRRRAGPRWRRSSRRLAQEGGAAGGGGGLGLLGRAHRGGDGAHRFSRRQAKARSARSSAARRAACLLVLQLGGARGPGGGVELGRGSVGEVGHAVPRFEWRKRVGVEPTRDRLTAPPGFEVRTPHRGRFSSRWRAAVGVAREEVEPPRVDAAQVAAAQGDAVAVEELEDLDRHLAAVVEPVAELRGAEAGRCSASSSAAIADHLADGVAQEEVVVGDLVHAAHAGEELAEAADLGLVEVELGGDVADPRRAEAGVAAEQRRDLLPELLVLGRRAGPRGRRGRTQAPSSATPPGARLGLQQRRKAGAGRRGSSAARRRSMPMPTRSGFSAWKASSVARSARSSRVGGGARQGERAGAARRCGRCRRSSSAKAVRREAAVAGEGVGVEVMRRRGRGARRARRRGRGWRGPRAGRGARACGGGGRGRAGRGSAPPPRVRWALVSRMTKRSPAAAAIGRSRTSWTRPRGAGRDRRRRGGRRGRRPRPRRGAGGPAATGRPAGLAGEHAEVGVDAVGRARAAPGRAIMSPRRERVPG